jgi:hypothetical protein
MPLGLGLGRQHFQVAAGSHCLGLLRDPTYVFAPCHGGPMVYCQAFFEVSPTAPVRNDFESHGTGGSWLFGLDSGPWSRLVGPGPRLGLGVFCGPAAKDGACACDWPEKTLELTRGHGRKAAWRKRSSGTGVIWFFGAISVKACPVPMCLADTKKGRLGPRPGQEGGRCFLGFGARQVSLPGQGTGPAIGAGDRRSRPVLVGQG